MKKQIFLCTVLFVSVYINVLEGANLQFEVSSTYLGSPYCNGLSVGDIEGDGDIDIAIGSNFNTDRVIVNNGDGTLNSVFLGASEHRYGVELVDFDQDGDLDFSWGTDGLVNNNGTFEATSYLNIVGERSFVFADLNGDGYPDAAGASYSYGFIAINQQGQGFQTTQSDLGGSNEYGVDAADVDNDGDIDIAIHNKIWLNDGTGVFVNSQQNLFVGETTRNWDRDFADLNGDGYVDIVISDMHHGCYVMLNDKSGGVQLDPGTSC